MYSLVMARTDRLWPLPPPHAFLTLFLARLEDWEWTIRRNREMVVNEKRDISLMIAQATGDEAALSGTGKKWCVQNSWMLIDKRLPLAANEWSFLYGERDLTFLVSRLRPCVIKIYYATSRLLSHVSQVSPTWIFLSLLSYLFLPPLTAEP